MKKRNGIIIFASSLIILEGFHQFIILANTSNILTTTMKYDFTGPHLFSAWFIVKSSLMPISVTANNTGIIPQYMSLQALNNTIIGFHYNVTATVSSTTTMTYINGYSGKTTTQTRTTTHGLGYFQNRTETGWYWDSTNKLLYIHFQTWKNNKYHVTEITVQVSNITPITTDTQTVTVTVTVTPTVTVTITTIIIVTVTTTTTTTTTMLK